MKVLVTGNKGYIGTVLTKILREKSYDVTGYDTDYYAGSEIDEFDSPFSQILKDIRNISLEDVAGHDAIIHLAAARGSNGYQKKKYQSC